MTQSFFFISGKKRPMLAQFRGWDEIGGENKRKSNFA